ncbi:hypothetical protein H105_01109 [Trichophyton soudanense CBS 452.61]|uniref:Uncharacterized protein n=1 Tax=Trichophyton soudanense CBS 452.61 TaxID=1215331 RepID=A0A022Y4C8_TRISD|nr:hypothetical protein H105_01109 [Trichophyton soudanense CBS 452.61]
MFVSRWQLQLGLAPSRAVGKTPENRDNKHKFSGNSKKGFSKLPWALISALIIAPTNSSGGQGGRGNIKTATNAVDGKFPGHIRTLGLRTGTTCACHNGVLLVPADPVLLMEGCQTKHSDLWVVAFNFRSWIQKRFAGILGGVLPHVQCRHLHMINNAQVGSFLLFRGLPSPSHFTE